VDALLARCREAGLRRTKLLERVLAVLLGNREPVAVKTLLETPGLGDTCDPATLYRLLGRLQGAGIVRRLGLHERAAYYELVAGNAHHRDYVVCTVCGRLQALDMHCPVEPLEAEVARRTGFRHLHHELQYYGICPRCLSEN